MAADLLRTPPLTEQLADHLTEVAVGVDPASVMPSATCGGAAMRRGRTGSLQPTFFTPHERN
ncbi:hypothetical protein [Mycobacterium marinum]|uniref:hypothetical protein n=1 Tax=Mycobacterium marinum TaxID=1781 RepID=UPI0003041F56